jgi:hypothetical protein
MSKDDDTPIAIPFPNDEEYAKAIAEWPEPIRLIAEKWPANKCWRSKNNPRDHYTIHDYARDKITGEPKLKLVHGSGDPRAGVMVYDSPNELVPCDCGKWAWPTNKEKRAMLDHINQHRAARGLAPIPWQEPQKPN